MGLFSSINTWVNGNLFTATQVNQMDTNIVQAGTYLENLSAIPFFGPKFASVGATINADAPMIWCERGDDTRRGFWLFPHTSSNAYFSDAGGVVSSTGASYTGTIYDGADNGTTTVMVGGTNSYYFTDPTSWTSLAGITGRAVKWDGTNFVMSSVTAGFRYSADGTSFTTASTLPTNWAAGSNAASQMATDGTTIVAVADTGSAKSYFAYSTDSGVNWSEVAVADKTWTGIAYRPSSSPSGALWVAVADTGEVYTSSDGTSWGLATTLTYREYPINKVHVLNDWFTTLGVGEDIMFSKDGVNWKAGDKVSYPSLSAISFGVGRYNLAGIVRDGSSAYLWTTTSAPLLSLVGV